MLKIKNIIFELIFYFVLKYRIKRDFIPNNYLFFLNEKDVELYFKDNLNLFQDFEKSKIELECLKQYAGNLHLQMNDILRNRNSFYECDFFRKKIDVLTGLLSKYNLKKNIIVVRRVHKKCISINKDLILNDKGFLSTSINLSYRQGMYHQKQLLNNEIVMLLKVSKKTNACYIGNVYNDLEYELLIQRDRVIKIQKYMKIFNNGILIGEILN